MRKVWKIEIDSGKDNTNPVCLGVQGENLATKVIFDIKKWIDDYGNGVVTLYINRPDGVTYPCVVLQDGEEVIWDVKDVDTSVAGFGYIALSFTAVSVNDVNIIVKSKTIRTVVSPSLDYDGSDPPDPYEPILDRMNDLAIRTENAAIRQPTIGSNGNWYLWDAETSIYRDSGISARTNNFGLGVGLLWTDTVSGKRLDLDMSTAIMEGDLRPITSDAVYVEIGNVGALLSAI